VSEPGLFAGVLARGAVRAEVDDVAWLQAMLDVEAALARAQGSEHAPAIAAVCQAELYDIGRLGADAALSANPIVPLVQALRDQVGPDLAADVHRGATSQDVLDSATMLVAHRALGALLEDLGGAADAATALAADHRETAISGRTLLQQAVPTTFGLKAAGWMTALDEAAARLEAVRDGRLAVQLGGAAGTMAAFGADGPQVLAALARELGLAEPVLPWHTDRTRIAELAAALGEASGVAAKTARDVVLLASTDVGEVREGGDPRRGGSSAMPHKRNPVAAVSALACALQAPGLVATLLGAMAGEHERAAGAWQAEWEPLTDLLRLTGSAAAWVRDCLDHLQPDPQRMRANLDAFLATVEGGEQFDLDRAVPAAAALVDRALRGRTAGSPGR
jgi:3-carboxy-cis,cis-muconate cycloisomerase